MRTERVTCRPNCSVPLSQTYKDRPVVARNSAPHSGAAAWVRGLKERIEEPMSKVSVGIRAGGSAHPDSVFRVTNR